MINPRDITELAVSLFYPRRCPVCGERLRIGEGLAHESCRKKLRYLREPRCAKCGKSLMDPRQEYCHDCRRRTSDFDAGRGIWLHDKYIRQSLYEFKYANRREYADFYAEEALRLYGDWIRIRGIDAVVPVPLHADKYRARGYNQAEIFAGKIAKGMGIPLRTDILRRRKSTTALKDLDPARRRRSAAEAFMTAPGAFVPPNILLADDIYTTGNTASYCARALKKAGAERVFVITVSTGGNA